MTSFLFTRFLRLELLMDLLTHIFLVEFLARMGMQKISKGHTWWVLVQKQQQLHTTAMTNSMSKMQS